MIRLFQLISLIVLTACPAKGMLFWNLDNTANTTNPGTGVPWGSVPKVINSTGSLISGSAVYLGNGYVLTANHVTMDSTYDYVTFNGVEKFQIDTTYNDGVRAAGKQVAAGVDMAVFKLTTIPTGVAAVNLLTTGSEQIAQATQIGWGVGRDPLVALGTATVAWGDSTTSAERWGLNVPKATQTISYSGYSYDSLVTIAGGTGGPYNPDGLGDAEAATTLLDSGSGLFQNISGTWYLIGLTTTVEQSVANSSVFGNDRTTSPRGDANFFVRISTYDSQILGLIPEPTTLPLALGGVLVALVAARRRSNKRSGA